MLGGLSERRLPNDYLYQHAGGDRRDCQPEPGDGIDVLAGTVHVYRLWTVTLPVGPAT
jgi:hypothetical protein